MNIGLTHTQKYFSKKNHFSKRLHSQIFVPGNNVSWNQMELDEVDRRGSDSAHARRTSPTESFSSGKKCTKK